MIMIVVMIVLMIVIMMVIIVVMMVVMVMVVVVVVIIFVIILVMVTAMVMVIDAYNICDGMFDMVDLCDEARRGKSVLHYAWRRGSRRTCLRRREKLITTWLPAGMKSK